MGLAGPPHTVARGPTVPRPGHPRRREEPVDGRATDHQPLVGLQLLGQVRGVQARIAAPGYGEDALLEGAGETTGRRLPPIAMHEGMLARNPDRSQKPPNLPQPQSEAAGRLAARDAVLEH